MNYYLYMNSILHISFTDKAGERIERERHTQTHNNKWKHFNVKIAGQSIEMGLAWLIFIR